MMLPVIGKKDALWTVILPAWTPREIRPIKMPRRKRRESIIQHSKRNEKYRAWRMKRGPL
jgi:hypothetical protein